MSQPILRNLLLVQWNPVNTVTNESKKLVVLTGDRIKGFFFKENVWLFCRAWLKKLAVITRGPYYRGDRKAGFHCTWMAWSCFWFIIWIRDGTRTRYSSSFFKFEFINFISVLFYLSFNLPWTEWCRFSVNKKLQIKVNRSILSAQPAPSCF